MFRARLVGVKQLRAVAHHRVRRRSLLAGNDYHGHVEIDGAKHHTHARVAVVGLHWCRDSIRPRTFASELRGLVQARNTNSLRIDALTCRRVSNALCVSAQPAPCFPLRRSGPRHW
jgi:hypothetical protein